MKNVAKFNANRKAANQDMEQVMLGNVIAGLANGTIEKIRPFTTGDGFLYTNRSKGNLLFVVASTGVFYSVAKYL